MPEDNAEQKFHDVRKGLIEILREGLSKLGVMTADNVKSWMDYRRSIFLATITLLTVVTPFADTYARNRLMFWMGYLVLLLSAITGLITEEVGHWTSHQVYVHGKKYTKEAIDKLFASSNAQDLKAAHAIFMKSGDLPKNLERRASWSMVFSTIAMIAFIIGLTLVGLAMLPGISEVTHHRHYR